MRRLLVGVALLVLAGCGNGRLAATFRPDTRNGFVATMQTTENQDHTVRVGVDLVNQGHIQVETSVDCRGYDVYMQVYGPSGGPLGHIDPYRPTPACAGPQILRPGDHVTGGYTFDGKLWDTNRNVYDAPPGHYTVRFRVSGRTPLDEVKSYELETSFDWNTP